jgi:hypothetical protein
MFAKHQTTKKAKTSELSGLLKANEYHDPASYLRPDSTVRPTRIVTPQDTPEISIWPPSEAISQSLPALPASPVLPALPALPVFPTIVVNATEPADVDENSPATTAEQPSQPAPLAPDQLLAPPTQIGTRSQRKAAQKTERLEFYKRLLKHMTMRNVEELVKQHVQDPDFADLDPKLDEDLFYEAIALVDEERETYVAGDWDQEKVYADTYEKEGDYVQASYWRSMKGRRMLAESKGEINEEA